MTLLQAINKFNEKITVTDRQEGVISASIENLESNLLDPGCGLNADETFLNGSYERDTIIRPLDDVDIFLVLDTEKYFENGALPDPVKVLQKIKGCLNNVPEYEGKVKRDTPCITIELSKIDFDVLPSFPAFNDIYYIPTYDLSGWTISQPTLLTSQLEEVNRKRKYLVKPLVRSIKKWNVINDKLIPSFHIEEIAIWIFDYQEIKNLYQGILLWFRNAKSRFDISKFKDQNSLEKAVKKYDATLQKLEEADEGYSKGDEEKAIAIWKEIFGVDFPTIDEEEAKNFSKALTEGGLKSNATGELSTSIGVTAVASKGFFGDESK
jgi:hypothetical protein